MDVISTDAEKVQNWLEIQPIDSIYAQLPTLLVQFFLIYHFFTLFAILRIILLILITRKNIALSKLSISALLSSVSRWSCYLSFTIIFFKIILNFLIIYLSSALVRSFSFFSINYYIILFFLQFISWNNFNFSLGVLLLQMVLPSLILCLAHAGIYRLNWSSSGLEIAKKYDLKWPCFLMKLSIVFLADSNVFLRSRLRRNSLPLSIFLRNKSKHHNLHFLVSLNLSLFNKWRLEYVHHTEIAICIWNRIQMLKVCRKGLQQVEFPSV